MAKIKSSNSVVVKKANQKDEPTNFAKNLRLLRVSHGDSQDSLAKKIGVNLMQAGNYERGAEPRYAVLVKIAKLYKVTIDDLLVSEYEIGQKKKAK